MKIAIAPVTNTSGLLLVLFVGLKLTHHIDWSWWWVMSPLWISASVGLAIVTLAAIAYGMVSWWCK